MGQTTKYPSIEGRCVFITGGATGIGAAMVEAFAMQGAKVAFVDLDVAAAVALCANLQDQTGTSPWFRQIDVTDVDALQGAIAVAVEELGPLQALINNAANDNRHSPAEVTAQSWRDCMAINLDAAFFAAQAGAELMAQQAGGSIINFSSINALLGPSNMPGYVTAKAGIVGMTKALARDFGESHIRVNAILPGWVVTERQLASWLTPEAEADWMKQVALKERLQPSEVANLALFLVADDSRMITGQSFTIDGGRT
ncbi:MAG: SDR family NAD(P)-dependent oxidoreductase [Porticoccaceae bacterium]|nr:SDR family NAD(P)-dependent oxidoreductase [Porticoccaceae bacterium]